MTLFIDLSVIATQAFAVYGVVLPTLLYIVGLVSDKIPFIKRINEKAYRVAVLFVSLFLVLWMMDADIKQLLMSGQIASLIYLAIKFLKENSAPKEGV